MSIEGTDTAEAPVLVEESGGGDLATATESLLKMLDSESETPATEVEETLSEAPDPQPEKEGEVEEEVEDEDSDDEYEPETEPEVEGADVPDVFTVKIDGTDTEVTLDELQAGYSRQADYTRKTQELANERKTLEEALGQYQQEITQGVEVREQYVQAIGQFIAQANSNLGEYSRIDWKSLKENDPIEYVTKRDEFREHQGRIQHAQQLQKKAAEDATADRGKLLQQQVSLEHERMIEIVPDWADAAKRSEMASKIRGYADSVGFSSEEVEGLVDHRSLNILMKAMKYDALQNGQVKDKKIRNKPTLVKSGTSRTKDAANKKRRSAQINQLKKSGSYKDAAKLLEDLL